MRFFYLCLRLGFGFLLLSAALVLLGLVAANLLPYGGEMAYISTPNGFNRLYVMDVERQFSFHLKRDYVNDCCLTWSPDGHNLTFVSDMSSDGSTDIFSMNFHAPAQRLTDVQGADLYPAYSPDGQQIAYTSYGYGDPQIYLMNADGSQAHVLSGKKALVNLNPHPVWSSDGQSVLFSDFGNLNSLFAVSRNCVDPCEKTVHTVFDTQGLPLMTTMFTPLDQSRLFMAAFDGTKKGGYGIYSLDTRTTNVPEQLTVNSDLSSPAVAVKDHWIAFVSGTIGPKQSTYKATLFILDANCIGSEKGCASSLQTIATGLRTDDDLSWSPDGHWLAFVTVIQRVSHLNLLDTTCIWEHRDCADSIHAMSITSLRYIRPAWRPVVQ